MNAREVWQHEAFDFTPWLAENIGLLGNALGMDLELTGIEAPVGDFSVDLVAKDLGSGGQIVIENQLTATDHDHLGKLITYAAGVDAQTIVWLADTIREEHRQALDWLNQRMDVQTRFFGVVIEVLQIDDSKPALNFKIVVFPNEWRKATQRQRTMPASGRSEKYRAFYQTLIDYLRENHRFTGARLGQPQNWYSFASGYSGVGYSLFFTSGNKVRAEVSLNHRDANRNHFVFDALQKEAQKLGDEFGEQLEWERVDDRKGSRIGVYTDGSIEDDDQSLELLRRWSVERLLALRRCFDEPLGRVLARMPDAFEEDPEFSEISRQGPSAS